MRIRDLFGKTRKDAEDGPPVLWCGICMFTRGTEDITEADTVINGNAVCADHIYAVYDNQFVARVAHVTRKENR